MMNDLSPEDTGQLIYQAVYYENEELLRELLNANPGKVQFKDKYGRTPLHIASKNGNTAIVKLLIKAGADVNSVTAPSSFRTTPLHLAAVSGSVEVIKLLIEAGAELLATDLNDHCALELSQMANQFETACILIDAIEAERDHIQRLHEKLIASCIDGNRETTKEVLQSLTPSNSDAILNGATLDRKCALYIACLNAQSGIMNDLLSVSGHALIQPITHDTIIHAAISSQNPFLVETILKAFTHLVVTKNSDGSTVLHWASQCGNLDVVKILMEFPYEDSMISRIEDVSGRFSYDFVIDVNALDSLCRTALYLAVANSHFDVVKYLLEINFPSMNLERKCPFQLDVYCSGGRTPLMVASANSDISIVKLLLDYGADINLPSGLTDADISSVDGARCIGSGALNEACKVGCLSLVQLLLQRGAVDHDNIALAIAIKQKQETIIQILLLRLAFVDSECRLNKKGIDFGQMSLNRNLLPSSVYPTTSCMLNWHNASLSAIENDWLISACLHLNPRLKTSRMALAALTRIDISSNKLKFLPGSFLQLPSLRSLNASCNSIQQIVIPNDSSWVAPLLETLSLELNELKNLPDSLFSMHLPNLSYLDVSYNNIKSLPDTFWMAPKLRELNLSNNLLTTLPAVLSAQPRSLTSNGCRDNNMPDTVTLNSNLSTEDSISMNGRVDDQNVIIHELKRHNVWQKNISLVQSDDSDVEIGSIASSSSLLSLIISHNNLETLPSCLACCCPRLTRLNISSNRLTSLGSVSCLPARLKHLDVSNNRLVIAFEKPTPLHFVCHAGGSSCFQQARQNSPTRNPRSRSRSAVRSQRSLSVARAPDLLSNMLIDACPHKQHSKLESLRTFQASKNRLLEIPFCASNSTLSSSTKRIKDREKFSIRKQDLLFPLVTSLDVSDNCIRVVPPSICYFSSLSTLNLGGNVGIEVLPPELGLLGKLWNLNLKGCSLRDPIRSLVQVQNYKTVDLIAYLKSILEDSRKYTRLKLMIVGVEGIGKTSLLQQIRIEGSVSKRSSNDSWSKRVGNVSVSGDRTAKGANISTVGVDIGEWTFEPRKTKSEPSFGPITFRTWDFGGQREYYATHQYFLSRRSLYLVVWKTTDGEAAIPDLHQWLVNIQARAPNSPVIIVGTHVDQILSNIDRFPMKYLEQLDSIIRDRFVLVADADKKGLPRVVDSIFVSSKSKYNIRALCNLLYRTAFDIRSAGSKERLLDQKVPASYLAFEKIALDLSEERRASGIEPVMRSVDFRNVVQERMLKNYGRDFRDDIEFNHACSFLHENGVILHYEDVTLRELFFLDPQWLCDVLAHVITIREINPFAKNGLMKIDDLNILFKSLKLSNTAINLRSHIISLLHKFEVALTWQSRSLLIPSLLPDEYQLRGGYPGSRVVISTKMTSWMFDMMPAPNPPSLKKKPLQLQSLFYRKSIDDFQPKMNFKPKTNGLSMNYKESTGKRKQKEISSSSGTVKDNLACTIHSYLIKKEVVRRVYVMAYIPSGFWSRLMTRILGDDHISSCIEKLFQVELVPTDCSVEQLKSLCDSDFRPEWLLWQTGIEIIAFGRSLFILRQFLPLAEVRDVHYEHVELRNCGEDGQWRPVNLLTSSLIELIIPLYRINIVQGLSEFVIRTDHTIITRLLALIIDLIDTLLEDWYPSLGTRFVHTSEGRLLVSRLIPCPACADQISVFTSNDAEMTGIQKASNQCPRSQTISNFGTADRAPLQILNAFTVEECILCAHNNTNPSCPLHSFISLSFVAPDVVFLDISRDFLIPSEAIKRTKMIGRGAFGFVFKATIKNSNNIVYDVALKMLEPTEPGIGARATSISAYKAAHINWQRDPLQNACRAYCTCRQELNVLASLQHTNITSLIGICPRPLTLIVELAPLGALNHLLSNYRRSGARLYLSVIQDTASQVAKALEYLHEHRIIYRDLKCENVLSWRFPPPFSMITDVLVKLGDYGISRSSFPSGGAKGYGGTEGFMAPEIMRYNGEQEYTEKVDCFSFAMFLYELITLKLPFDGQEQVKEYILDGGRPKLTPSELLFPCNVLDVMVVCWAGQPMDRPSASQIVSMTTAPEFIHLLDVISLNDADSSINSSIAFSTFDEPDVSQSLDDSIEGEVWFSRSDSSISILGCNQYGWLDSKSISVGLDGTVITALCFVNDSVWMSESTGLIRIFCRNSYTELRSFSIARYLPAVHFSITVVSLTLFSSSPAIVLITLPSALLLINGDKSVDNNLIAIIHTTTIYSSVIVDSGNNLRQIWTGNSGGNISSFALMNDNVFNCLFSLSHDEDICGLQNGTVSYLLTSRADPSLVWSIVTPGSKIYQWSVADRKITCKLDARKIFPSSESISTLDIEAARDGCVTAIALLDKSDGAQLYIGTNKGVVIVAQALQMRPLAAFRPYLGDVSHIIALDGPLSDSLKNWRETSVTSVGGLTSSGPKSIGGVSTNSASGEFLETMNWVKGRVSETVGRFRLMSTDSPPSFGSYVITVGNGYRCLIDRFTDRKHQSPNPSRCEAPCAIIWHTDDWIS